MFNATLKRFFFILLIATLAGLAGCSNPEKKRVNQLDKALELSEAGQRDAALAILEALQQDYPNDGEILQLIGQIYAEQGDPTTAAFFLEQAYLQQPDDVELLYRTYQFKEAAGQPSGETLEKLAELSPATMTRDLWIKLGAVRAEKNQTESALEAYLKGIDPDKEAPVPETAAAIGQLFAQLGNHAQAANWLEMAADNDDPVALTALFGLLQIQLNDKNWPGAEATIARLNKQFPGAVEASRWKQSSDELQRWRAAQEKMQAQLAARQAEQEQAAAEKEAGAESELEVAASDDSDTETAGASGTSEAGTTAEKDAAGGKSQVIADLAAAEALANQPATESPATGAAAAIDPNSPAVEASAENNIIAFDPNIAITPADPDWRIEVDFDQQANAPETSFSVAPGVDTEPAAAVAPEAAQVAPAAAASPEITPAEPAKSLEELLAEAQSAELERNYKKAIQKYWAATSANRGRADIWNLLARAYRLDGQLQNADTAALESVRLAPREVAYTLDFLRVAQRSRPPQEFLAQLETAYDRFPTSPEITLSLARAHERISKDKFVARNLYLRFVDIAPNHPLRSEAEAAAARLK